MDTYKSFTDSILTPTPTVLGVKLLPYSLGHAIILKKIKSVFVMNGLAGLSDIKILNELAIAIIVCSTTYDEFYEEVNSGEIETLIKEYVRQIYKGMTNNESINGKDQLLESLAFEVEKFTDYLTAGTTTPRFYKIDDADSASNFSTSPIEVEQAIMSALMSECNYLRDEALNLPLTETLNTYLLLGYNRGVISWDSREVFELKQKLKK